MTHTTAVVLKDYGDVPSIALEAMELPSLSPDQVEIEIRAAGVSYVDSLIARGKYQLKPSLPFVLGTECAGVVTGVGGDVSAFAPGDRVSAVRIGGAFAQRAVVSANTVYKIPSTMSFKEAAVFRVSFATAYYALARRGLLEKGEVLLVLGAGGAVGHAAIQVGKALGARVLASASTEGKRQFALRAGADATIDSGSSSWRDEVRRATAQSAVDVVFDPVGGNETERAFRSLAWQGRHLMVGFAAGSIPSLPANLALLKGASLVGVDVRQFGERQPAQAAVDIARLFNFWEQGWLKPVIAATYPLERFAEALKVAGGRDAIGRIVMDMTSH